jgi:hypothetical protein
MLFAMLAIAALAIDLASIRSARSEAQRAADAVALAGASAFYDLPAGDPTATDEAQTRALNIARLNTVRGDTLYIDNPAVVNQSGAYAGGGFVRTVTTQDVTLNIIPATDSQKVRAWVRRPGVQTFFGGLIGKPYGHVQAMATAWASNAGPTPKCLKPFLIPDMWDENNLQQDKNNNNYMEPDATANGNGNGQNGGEQWFYEPGTGPTGDRYAPFDPTITNPPLPQTGYGSNFRGVPGDVGLPILFKPQTGNNQRQGNSYFTLDGDEQNLREDIKVGCIDANVGDTPNWSQGGATGQARQGIQYLINQDPGATWNPVTKRVDNSAWSDWTQSPRVIIVGLMDPIYIKGSSKNVKPDAGAKFSNFARLFLQDAPGNTDNLKGLFLGFAPGGAGGPVAGSLVRRLQLIE